MNADNERVLIAIDAAARAAHEANRAYCLALGDVSLPSWEDAPPEQRDSVRAGVQNVARGFGPRESHNAWWQRKHAEGWTFDVRKDSTTKTHPNLVPYDDLPREEKMKDSIFVAVVSVILTALDHPPVPR